MPVLNLVLLLLFSSSVRVEVACFIMHSTNWRFTCSFSNIPSWVSSRVRVEVRCFIKHSTNWSFSNIPSWVSSSVRVEVACFIMHLTYWRFTYSFSNIPYSVTLGKCLFGHSLGCSLSLSLSLSELSNFLTTYCFRIRFQSLELWTFAHDQQRRLP